jgi:hypothetical protein
MSTKWFALFLYNWIKEYIKILNVEWLQKYFRIEDRNCTYQIHKEIIDKGGLIYFITYNDQIVGTVSFTR